MTTHDSLSTPTAATAGCSLALLPLLRWFIALLVVACSIAGGAWLLHLEPTVLPVRVVKVDGTVHRLSAPHLARTLTEHLQSGLLTQDLHILRDAVEALPWVHSASLRRVWPDQIVLAVSEHRPIARWGDDGLVTGEGIVFRPQAESLPTGLPQLNADDARAPQVAGNYLKWHDHLAALGLKIATLTMDARGAWTLYLANGLRLELGTERVEERLGRFIRTYPQLAAAGEAELVDLRYANGLAVRWAPGAAPGEAKLAQSEVMDQRVPEARPVRAKAAPGGAGRNKSRNKG